jgi:predicted transcriptional regulator
VTVDVETSIVEVAEMFLNSPFKRYPVLKDNRLVGQISRSDVLKAIEALSTT